MASRMPHDVARKKIIEEHLNRQQDDARGKGPPLQQQKLIVKGRAELTPVYRLDVSDLAFNKSNGRIKAEVAEKEGELGRQLNVFDRDDQGVIRGILVTIRPDENDKIKEDLKKNGQVMPGIVTCDGIVVNGNRRKAILEELYQETNDNRYKYLDVQVLPSDITKAELWLIEAGIQLSASQQLEYTPINHLLKLREGINAGLAIADMAARIYGVSEDQWKADLERLDLIDEFLRDYLAKEAKYFLVNRLNEHFIDLQKMLSWAHHRRGRVRSDWTWDESDLNELKAVAFTYIRMGMPHMRIRDLRDIFATRASWLEVRRAANVDPQLPPDECTEIAATPAVVDDEEEEAPQDATKSPAAVEEGDIREEAIWKRKWEPQLKSIYEDAKEKEQIVKDSERPIALARRALRNIEAIPEDPDKLTEPELDGVLADIISETNARRKVIRKQPADRRSRNRHPGKRPRRAETN